MAIINGPDRLVKAKLDKDIKDFIEENGLTKEEKNELDFICQSFLKFYNAMARKETAYSPKMIAEAFDTMIKSSVSILGSGLETRAKLYYKEVDCIKNVLVADSLDKKIKEEKKSRDTSSDRLHEAFREASRRNSVSYSSDPCSSGGSRGPSC